MKITEKLQLAIPVNESLTAYHTAISREVFEANYRIIAATKAALSGKGMAYQLGATLIASLTLKDEAEKIGDDAIPLLSEIKRLTLILAPSATGYDYIPVETAINRGIMDDEDWREVESGIVFFTCYCAMAKKSDKADISTAVASLLSGAMTSLSIMEYGASLRVSTNAETGNQAAASSVPL